MSIQSTNPTEPVVSVTKLANLWFGVKVCTNGDKIAFGKFEKDYKTAETVAIKFALQNDLLFVANYVKFNKAVVTIWKHKDCWVCAKLFEDKLTGAGLLRETKEEALKDAEWVAKRDDLDYIPQIGLSAFDKV